MSRSKIGSDVVTTCCRFPFDLINDVRLYADEHYLSVNGAVCELIKLGFEHVKFLEELKTKVKME